MGTVTKLETIEIEPAGPPQKNPPPQRSVHAMHASASDCMMALWRPLTLSMQRPLLLTLPLIARLG